MALKIRGGQVKSINSLKKSIKRGSSTGAIKRIPKEAPLTVRFLEEPDRWFEFFEHYDPEKKKGGVCVGDGCLYCADDVRANKRLLANAVDMDESRVIALAMPTSLVNILLKKYDKYGGTLLDRDYELAREGEGMDTEYDATPEAQSRFNYDAYEVLDLGAILEAEVDQDDDDDDEDEKFLPPAKRTTARRGGSARRVATSDSDEDDVPRATKRMMPIKKVAPKTLKKGLRRS